MTKKTHWKARSVPFANKAPNHGREREREVGGEGANQRDENERKGTHHWESNPAQLLLFPSRLCLVVVSITCIINIIIDGDGELT